MVPKFACDFLLNVQVGTEYEFTELNMWAYFIHLLKETGVHDVYNAVMS
jgi:hypothetical protein